MSFLGIRFNHKQDLILTNSVNDDETFHIYNTFHFNIHTKLRPDTSSRIKGVQRGGIMFVDSVQIGNGKSSFKTRRN